MIFTLEGMKVFVDEFYYDNIKKSGANAMIGTFDKYYRSSRSFIAELAHLGPILVSVAREDSITRALVRSVLGFREYKWYNRHIGGCPYIFGVKNSLSHYFCDVVQDWSYSEAITAGKRSSSVMGILSSIFSFGSSWPLADGSNRAPKGMYDQITSRMMEEHEEFAVEKIVWKMAEVGPEHAGELDREFHRRPIYVDVVVEDVGKIPFGLLGSRVVEMGDEDFSVSYSEMDAFRVEPKSSGRKLRAAVVGFVLNELEYFNQLNEFYHRVVSGQRREGVIFEALFRGFMKVYEFEMEFLGSMARVIDGLSVSLSKIIEDPLYFEGVVEDVRMEGIGLTDCEIVEEVFGAFNTNFRGFKCYEELMLSHEESMKVLRRCRDEHGTMSLSEGDAKDCFYKCLQRIVRYPLIINEILRNIGPDEAFLAEGKTIYLRMVKFISVVDKKKERYDNLRSSMVIRERIANLPADMVRGEEEFFFQLDCEDVYGDPMTLFLLSNVLVVADRRGPPVSILDSDSKRYVARHVLGLEKMDAATYGKSGLKIIVALGGGTDDDVYHMKEEYGDVCMGVLYFAGCSSWPRTHFLREFYRTRIGVAGGVYVSFGSLFFRVVRNSLDIDENGDLVIYTDHQDFVSSSGTSVGYLDLNDFTFKLRDETGAEYGYREEQDTGKLRDRFAEFIVNAVQFKRAFLASLSTPKDNAQVFARYRICLKEIVEKYSDSALVRFGETLSQTDLISTSQKISKAKAMIGYISRSVSYMKNKDMGLVDPGLNTNPYDTERIGERGMRRLLKGVLGNSEIEDTVLDKHRIEDVLYILMYFIHTNIYAFMCLEDISAIHEVLFVRRTYCLRTMASMVSTASAPFVSSLFDLIIALRDKIDISPVLDAFCVILGEFGVSKTEISTVFSKIHW